MDQAQALVHISKSRIGNWSILEQTDLNIAINITTIVFHCEVYLVIKSCIICPSIYVPSAINRPLKYIDVSMVHVFAQERIFPIYFTVALVLRLFINTHNYTCKSCLLPECVFINCFVTTGSHTDNVR
jgi:hypothetical protein